MTNASSLQEPVKKPHRKTAIQWTDETDNIIVAKGGGWWCAKISPGCKNCYAEKLNDSAYFKGNHLRYSGTPPEMELRRGMIAGWARQRKARKHFVASMTDIFGEWVPQEWVFEMLDGMAAAPLQTFQVLTKRASVMAEQVLAWLKASGRSRVPNNIWLGFSAEDQYWFDRRAKHAAKLRDVCDVLWVSAEPLLGELVPTLPMPHEAPFKPDWIVLGGESGPGASPCDVQWIRGVLDWRDEWSAETRIFVKQLGGRSIREIFDARGGHLGHEGSGLRHKKGGDMQEWPEDLQVREFPQP